MHFQAEDGIRDVERSRGLGDVYKRQLIKDSMALIDTETAVSLYNEMSPTVQSSGGSAANTMSGVASLGGKAALSLIHI